MSDGPNIVGLPAQPDALRAAVEAMKRNAEAYVEMAAVHARIRRAYFLAYKATGFTDAEALELAKQAPL